VMTMPGLMRREPRGEVADVFSRFDHLFEEWARMMPFRVTSFPRWWEAGDLIRVEELREDGTRVIRADLPGIDPDKDVELTVSDGILHIPKIYLRAAHTLGTPAWAMPLRVIFPAALPSIVTGIKLGWTLGWHGAVSAELIKSSVGLGYLLYMGRELNDASQVLAIMVLTIVFGLLLDRFLFGLIEHRIRRRWGLLPAR